MAPLRQQPPQFRIHPFQRAGIARHVAAMPPEAVEFHKIGEGQRALLGLRHQIVQMAHQRGIVPLAQRVDALHRKDVADLAHRMHPPPRRLLVRS